MASVARGRLDRAAEKKVKRGTHADCAIRGRTQKRKKTFDLEKDNKKDWGAGAAKRDMWAERERVCVRVGVGCVETGENTQQPERVTRATPQKKENNSGEPTTR